MQSCIWFFPCIKKRLYSPRVTSVIFSALFAVSIWCWMPSRCAAKHKRGCIFLKLSPHWFTLLGKNSLAFISSESVSGRSRGWQILNRALKGDELSWTPSSTCNPPILAVPGSYEAFSQSPTVQARGRARAFLNSQELCLWLRRASTGWPIRSHWSYGLT